MINDSRKVRRINLILSYFKKILIRGDFALTDILPIYNRCLEREQRTQIINFLNSFNVSRNALSHRLKCGIDCAKDTASPKNSLEASLIELQSIMYHSSDLSDYEMYGSLSTNTMSEYEYYQYHLADVHDIWHILLNANTTPSGEIKVWSFLYAQIPADYGAFLVY